MKWLLLVMAVICASLLGGSERRFVPSYATAADSVQKMALPDTFPPLTMLSTPADSVQMAVSNLHQFMSSPRVTLAFLDLIREDKEVRARTGTDGPNWLAAKRNPRAYLASRGVTMPEQIAVTFLYTIPTGSTTGGLYSIEAGIGRRGGPCTSTAHPERTGAFVDRRSFPMSSIVAARRA